LSIWGERGARFEKKEKRKIVQKREGTVMYKIFEGVKFLPRNQKPECITLDSPGKRKDPYSLIFKAYSGVSALKEKSG